MYSLSRVSTCPNTEKDSVIEAPKGWAVPVIHARACTVQVI